MRENSASQLEPNPMLTLLKRLFRPTKTGRHTMLHAAAAPPPGSKIRVLAFGDSLTEGYHQWGTSFHPYGQHLQHTLNHKAQSFSWEVTSSGISGECVLQTMQHRLDDYLLDASSQGVQYQWVLLLAGVNDVGGFAPAAKVFQGLQHMYKACHSHGAQVVAMTLLENDGSLKPTSIDAQRKKLNTLIRDACTEEGMALCDLDVLLPYVSLEPNRRQELFDDGLHLTPKGYDHMAELIAKTLVAQYR